jgi:arylsulfate sulfotransferase
MSATTSALLNSWQLIDMLDPVRIDYLCFLVPQLFGVDPEHANAIIESPSDDSLIVSLRNQDAIVKFSRAGQITWILGPPENWGAEWQPYLLTPVGAPFEWNYGQHAPSITPQGTLLFYDDGNFRAEPFDSPVANQDNYSRAAEFSIDETNMQVSQVWEFSDTNDDRLFTGAVGNASWLPQTSNVLVTFGYVSYENGAPPDPIATNATVVRLKEVTHDPVPTVVFDLEMSDPFNTNPNSTGYMVYRSHRIPDLYPHLPVPVANLTAQIQPDTTLLQFTADPVRTYVVQSSPDLVNWNDIGEASADDEDGDFSYQDEYDIGLAAQFYRVLTQ